MRTITTTPGIGDVLFVFQKLINQPEKFHWRIWDGVKNGVQAQPRRGHQIFDLFPQLTESFEYVPNMGYGRIKKSNPYHGRWDTAPQEMILEANSHLEAGKRIEDFLPDLKTSFTLPYVLPKERHAQIRALNMPMLHPDTPPYIGIYTTSYGNARYASAWVLNEWMELIKLIQGLRKGYKFVFIGAPYDVGISDEIMARMASNDFINAIGQPLPVTIEVLKRLEMFIGFQSGLSIINETIGAKQTVMLYNHALERMMNTWPDPERIKSGAYKGCTFGPPHDMLQPKKLFEWMVENGKI